MDTRRKLLVDTWVQLVLVAVIVVLANTWAARTFWRLDLTEDRIYSLDLATKALMYRLDKPLIAKVYFTRGLQAPYNNHEQIVVDKLHDLQAYSRGLMEIEVTDPTGVKELEAEARRFGVDPIQYRFKSANVTEMRKVYMGVALVYGDRQQVLPAITQTDSLEYDLARAIRALVSDDERPTIGWATGADEPDLFTGKGPLERIRTGLQEEFDVVPVELGGGGLVPDEVDALFVVGPRRPVGDRALYQLDQFLMRGGALAVFVTNTAPDFRTLRPRTVYHGLGPLLGHYGVKLNRDVVVDRKRNGMMRFPVRQGRAIVRLPVNYPLIPRADRLDPDSPIVKGLESMLFPFASSLEIADPLPPEVHATVLAASNESSGRIRGIRTIDPNAYRIVAPGEERGSWPLLVALTGQFDSYFADKDIPPADDPDAPPDDPAAKLRTSAPTRLVVAGSADFIANNVPFVLNLADWMVQDESLIGIRSKTVRLAPLEPLEPARARLVKLANLGGGAVLLLVFVLVRWLVRRRGEGVREEEAA